MGAAPSTKLRMTAGARRQQLLDVTTDLVAEGGFHGVSIEQVARRAGITRAVVYQHFGDLPTLLESVVEREMARALEQVSRTALADLDQGDPRELMLDSLAAFLGAVQDHPTTWRLVLMPPNHAPEVLRERIGQGRASVLERMAAAVRPALHAEGAERDAELTASVLSAIADDYARLLLTDPDRYPPDRLLRHARGWLGRFSLAR